MTETFNFSSKTKYIAFGLIGVGVLGVVLGLLVYDPARLWANILLNSYYFIGISLAAVFFVAAHQVGYSGWHTIIKRIPEAMSAFIPVAGGGLLLIVLGMYFHWHHLYHWTDDFIQKESVTVGALIEYESSFTHHDDTHHQVISHEGDAHVEAEDATHDSHDAVKDGTHHGNDEPSDAALNALYAGDNPMAGELGHHETFASDYAGMAETEKIANPHYDSVIVGKSGFLNIPFFSFRILIYIVFWSFLAYLLRSVSRKEDQLGGLAPYNKNKTYAAIFLVFFGVTSSTASWDIIMSIDTHWYSTLFGWYNFASYTVAGMSVIALLVVYLKQSGYLKSVNENHLHSIGLYMFGFSVFWTYLWFAQFLLIWYGNIPEATVYYAQRWDNTYFKILFFLLPVINFATPFLVLMRRSAKRDVEVMVFAAIVILVGHWLDFYVMIMPGAAGKAAGFGLLEISITAGFTGLFIFVVLNALTKASLVPTNNPYLKESINHHY